MGRHRRTDDEATTAMFAVTPDDAPAPASPAATVTDDGDGTQPQPVLTAAAVQAVLATAVTLGWLKLDDPTISTLATVIAGALALASAFYARRQVTPLIRPRDNDGRPLVASRSPQES